MGYIWAKDEGNKFFKHVPHFCYSTRPSGIFSLNVRHFYPSMNFQFSHCNLCVSQTSIKNSIFLPRTSSARWFLIFAAESSSKCRSVNRSWTALFFHLSADTEAFDSDCSFKGYFESSLCYAARFIAIKFLSMHMKILSSFLALSG